MPDRTPPRRLSGIDAAFLYLERREIPLSIAGVFLFDGPIDVARFTSNLQSRLHLLPRYRQVVIPAPFNLGYPTWEDYPRFDITEHIHHEILPAPGSEEQLQALAGHLFGQVMDRNKPLWELHIIDGLSGGRGVVIARLHHALADGIAGEALINAMFDETPGGVAPPAKVPAWRPIAAAAEPSIVDALAAAVHSSLRSMVAAEAALLDLGQALLTERMQSGLQGLLKLLPDWAKPAERLPFNRPCGGERKFCWTDISFADVQAIRVKLGGSVNDVILSVVADAVSRYTQLHGEPVAGRTVRVVCPVNVRVAGETGVGNQITFMPVILPLGIPKSADLVREVTNRTNVMKSVRTGELVAIAGAWLAATPPPLQALFWEGLPRLPLPRPLFNMICTNVPGSPKPLYAQGRRMIASYPQVPTGYELGIGVAVQSYDGRMFFGLTADAQAAADIARFRDCLQDAFGRLCRAAGIPKKRKPAAKPSRPAAHMSASAD